MNMPQQPNLFSSSPAGNSAMPEPNPAQTRRSRGTLWLRRVELLLFLVVRIYVGVIVLVLPWTPLWLGNPLLNFFPPLSSILMSGAARGVVSGLGLLNLWIAITEALQQRGPSD